MSRKWKLVLGISLFAATYLYWGGPQRSKAPDQKLAAQYGELCKIAKNGISEPHQGLQDLFGYYGKSGPNMLKNFGDLLVMIERIEDDGAHDKRAALASKRMSKVLIKCERTFEAFAVAVQSDEKASELLEAKLTRFARTLEILFPGRRGEGVMQLLPGSTVMTELAPRRLEVP
tara:strand:- start:19441 stop:19962 length:522 start_codon:yes stop_codon:yes gene_type:complete